jgi:Uma2 family endonuclease
MKSAADEPEIPVAPPGELELPYEDGEPMESNRHRQQMVLLIQTLKRAWSDRHDYFAGGNMFIYFSETQVKKNDFRGPDFFVVLGTTERDRRSWVAWGEDGKLPDVVVELLSDRTRKVDWGEKMQIYSRLWKTSEYFLYDPWSHELDGFRLDPATLEYVRIAADSRGDLFSQRLRLAIGLRPGTYEGVEAPWLRFIDGTGRVIETPEEADRASLAAAAAERRRADAEKDRADAEKDRADAEKDRADSEKDRADAERRRAEEAERRLAELLATLGKS